MLGLGKSHAVLASFTILTFDRPLNPDCCVHTELRLLPMAVGHLQIEAVRVVDVVSNDFVDVRDLPDIVAEAQADDTQ